MFLFSCPFFCNELGGETERTISISKDCLSCNSSCPPKPWQLVHPSICSFNLRPDNPLLQRNSSLYCSGAVTRTESCDDLTRPKCQLELNNHYISLHPCQYLYRPTSASTVGVIERLSDGLIQNVLQLSNISSDSKNTSNDTIINNNNSTSQPDQSVSDRSADSVHKLLDMAINTSGFAAKNQQMCSYTFKKNVVVEGIDCGAAYYKMFFSGKGK